MPTSYARAARPLHTCLTQPQLGEPTLDEMCLAGFVYVYEP
jgi:hypothetical protein